MKKNRNGLNDLARFYHKNLKKNLIRISHLQTILKVACEIPQKTGTSAFLSAKRDSAAGALPLPKKKAQRHQPLRLIGKKQADRPDSVTAKARPLL